MKKLYNLRNAAEPLKGNQKEKTAAGKKNDTLINKKELGITIILGLLELGIYLLLCVLFSEYKDNFYLISLFAFVMTILVMLAIGSGQSKASHYERSALLFLILFVTFSMGGHYLKNYDHNTKSIKKKNVVWTGVSTAATTTVAISDAYGPGVYNLNIPKHQARLVRIVDGCKYTFSDKDTLVVRTTDGRTFISQRPGPWPNCDKLFVTNLGNKSISLIVTK